jgi:tight adherence protein C
MTELIAFAQSPVALISFAVGFSIFGVVFAATAGAAGRQERVARIRSVAARSQQGRPRRGGAGSNDDVMALIRRVVQKFNVVKDRQGQALAEKMARAGWRSRDSVTLYLFAKLSLPLLLILVALAFLFGVKDYGLPMMVRLGIVIAAGLLGSYLPELVVRNQTQKRNNSMRKALPDALDLLVICAEAGLSLDAALSRVAREIAPASRQLADELGLTILELRFMPDRRQALENLAKRVDLKAIQALVNTLFQTEKFGTPLAQALRVLSAEMRSERMLRAEEKAARLPAIMTVPLIMFILPALFIVLIGSAILDVGDAMSGF